MNLSFVVQIRVWWLFLCLFFMITYILLFFLGTRGLRREKRKGNVEQNYWVGSLVSCVVTQREKERERDRAREEVDVPLLLEIKVPGTPESSLLSVAAVSVFPISPLISSWMVFSTATPKLLNCQLCQFGFAQRSPFHSSILFLLTSFTILSSACLYNNKKVVPAPM